MEHPVLKEWLNDRWPPGITLLEGPECWQMMRLALAFARSKPPESILWADPGGDLGAARHLLPKDSCLPVIPEGGYAEAYLERMLFWLSLPLTEAVILTSITALTPSYERFHSKAADPTDRFEAFLETWVPRLEEATRRKACLLVHYREETDTPRTQNFYDRRFPGLSRAVACHLAMTVNGSVALLKCPTL